MLYLLSSIHVLRKPYSFWIISKITICQQNPKEVILVQNVNIFEGDNNCYIKVRRHQEHDGGLSLVITYILNSISSWNKVYWVSRTRQAKVKQYLIYE